MRPFAAPARKAVVDEPGLKHGLEHINQQLMNDPIAHRCFMNPPSLGVLDGKCGVIPVSVRLLA